MSLLDQRLVARLMGKHKNSHRATRVRKEDPVKRETQLVRLTVLYFLREKFNLDRNPESLNNPQPLSLLEVKSFLNDIVKTKVQDRKPDTSTKH